MQFSKHDMEHNERIDCVLLKLAMLLIYHSSVILKNNFHVEIRRRQKFF